MSLQDCSLADASGYYSRSIRYAPGMNEPADPRFLALKAAMMPRDTNPQGTIFGGVLLSYIDQAGAVGVQHEARIQHWPRLPIVTVGMKSVAFHEPVFVGDVVSFWTEIERVGRTSITVQVTVETDRDGVLIKLTEAEVTYVAVQIVEGVRQPVPIRGPDAP
ncbi:MAG TPA: hotdog domain-containing protein [Planctomycetaceae bacterium]|nr:hotdog domain-containing protein [Planctomycetaceae bacterium]